MENGFGIQLKWEKLIQRGWQHGFYERKGDTYASRKHFISPIDFINSTYSSKGFSLGDVRPLDAENLEPKETDREGSATFKIDQINDKDGQPIIFGLEVCLDHSSSWSGDTRVGWGRLRTADKRVKIQLVPSGGMSLVPDSIRLLPPTPQSYAFNCDGLTTLGPDRQWGAHTQIWNGAKTENELVNASSGQPANRTEIVKVPETYNNIDANKLWDLGSGYVRVMEPMPL
jgi:hypothetical protein